MQNASVATVDDEAAALRVLHRDVDQVAAFGRPRGGHWQRPRNNECLARGFCLRSEARD